MKPSPDLLEALQLIARALAPEIAKAVVLELQAGSTPDHIDQHTSVLGNRRHVAAIRSGKLTGSQIGRRWIAKREDVAAYAASLATKKPKANLATEELDLARELGIAVEHSDNRLVRVN